MSRVLINDERQKLLKAFRRRVKKADQIDIVTAWATDCEALKALAKANCAVRAIVGLSNRYTVPSALETLREMGEVKVVSPSSESGIFHPKVYIFRNGRKTLGWTGSANFSDGGFGRNYELVLETKSPASSKLTAWFDDLWNDQQRCELLTDELLNEYRDRFEKDPGWEPGAPSDASRRPSVRPNAKRVTKLHFKPEGKRPLREGQRYYRGSLLVTKENGETKHLRYRNGAVALRLVLQELSAGRDGFLRSCAGEFGTDKNGEQWLSKDENKVFTREHARRKEVIPDWWLSSNSYTDEKWLFIEKATKLAGVDVHSDKMWQDDDRLKEIGEAGF